jgi:uncharacterized protein YecE (DUF72 family)
MAIRIGISGWRYAPWRGKFYPKGLPQRRELEFAARCFDSVEINGSFYSLQMPTSYSAWHDATPPGFVFAVKGPRYLTHMLKLREVETPLANFFASGLLRLGDRLGPILWQLPPFLRFDSERLARFFDLLPRDLEQARALARRRDPARMRGRSALAIEGNAPLRHALEVRHESFRDPTFIDLLREHDVALVVADTAGRWPLLEDVTADFIYIRLHGDEELYVSGYDDEALDAWAERIRAWTSGRQPRGARRASRKAPPKHETRDVYCYFDNDAKVRAPVDALGLMRRLGLEKPAVTYDRKDDEIVVVDEGEAGRGLRRSYRGTERRPVTVGPGPKAR